MSASLLGWEDAGASLLGGLYSVHKGVRAGLRLALEHTHTTRDEQEERRKDGCLLVICTEKGTIVVRIESNLTKCNGTAHCNQ